MRLREGDTISKAKAQNAAAEINNSLLSSTHRCFAAIHLMWSSNVNVALSLGSLDAEDAAEDPADGEWTVTWRHRESSLSVTTSTSWRNPTKVATPQPSRVESGSTSTIW